MTSVRGYNVKGSSSLKGRKSLSLPWIRFWGLTETQLRASTPGIMKRFLVNLDHVAFMKSWVRSKVCPSISRYYTLLSWSCAINLF